MENQTLYFPLSSLLVFQVVAYRRTSNGNDKIHRYYAFLQGLSASVKFPASIGRNNYLPMGRGVGSGLQTAAWLS